MSEVAVTIERPVTSPGLLKSLGLVASSIFLSGVLYKVADAQLAPYLETVNRPLGEIPSWIILAVRAIEILGYAYAGLHSTEDILMLSFFSRSVYATLLHINFEIPLFVPIMSIAIDTLALWAPLQLLLTPKRAIARIDVRKDASLTIVLMLIGSSILSIALYVAQKTQGPAFMLGHFDQVRSIQASPLPLLLLAFLPTAFCLQGLVDKHGNHGIVAALVSSAFVGGAKIGLGIRGTDAMGVVGVVTYWNTAVAIASGVLKFILQV